MINFAEIQQIICSGEGISPDILQSKTRKREIVFIRQIVMYFLKTYTKESWSKIGSHYNKDHATALYSFGVINKLTWSDKDFAMKIVCYGNLIKRIGSLEKSCEIDEYTDLKELIKGMIENNLPLTYETILVYNKMTEKNISAKEKIIESVMESFNQIPIRIERPIRRVAEYATYRPFTGFRPHSL